MDKQSIDAYKLELLEKKLNEDELKIKVTVLNKQYWTNGDIAIMKNCGKTKASGYRSLIEDYIKTVLKKELPSQIPSKVAIKVLDIDEKKIRDDYRFTLEVTKSVQKSQQHTSYRTVQTV